MALTVLLPRNDYSAPLRALLEPMLPPGSTVRSPDDGLEGLRGERLLFAVALDEGGCNMAYYRMLSRLRRSETLLHGCVAGVVVTGVGEFYTKDVARDMVFAANQAGCAFLGRPLVEATGSLRNFRVQAQIGGTDEKTAFHAALAELIGRLETWEHPAPIRRVLALHASQRSTSNTLAFWELVRKALPPTVEVQEICLRNGTLADCNGCSYTACLHFGEQGGCFYGGPMVEEVYPAVRSCDALVMICANYNDALAANLTACVNRLEYDRGVLPAAALLSAGDGERAREPCAPAAHRRARRAVRRADGRELTPRSVGAENEKTKTSPQLRRRLWLSKSRSESSRPADREFSLPKRAAIFSK